MGVRPTIRGHLQDGVNLEYGFDHFRDVRVVRLERELRTIHFLLFLLAVLILFLLLELLLLECGFLWRV